LCTTISVASIEEKISKKLLIIFDLNDLQHASLFSSAASMNVTKENLRLLTETCRRNKMSAKDTHNFIVQAWGEVVTLRSVQRWFVEYTEGQRDSFEDGERCGRPKVIRTEENSDEIGNFIAEHPDATLAEISKCTGISPSSVHRILTLDLGKKWIIARWVPHLLSPEQQNERVMEASNILKFMKKTNSMSKLVVIDEKMVYHRPLGTKKTNAEWVDAMGDQPRIPHRTQFDPKTMIIVAVSFTGKHMVDVLQRGQSVNSLAYIDFLRRMNYNFRRHIEKLDWKDMALMHDNARVHTSVAVRDFLEERGVKVIRQAPYSPDMNLLDRFIFSTLERMRNNITFTGTEHVKTFTADVIRSIEKAALAEQYNKLIDHLNAVIACGGDYV
jgi:transposase